MTVYSEEIIPIPVGLGLDLYSHPANVPDGFCTDAINVVAKSESLVSRKGFQRVTDIDTRESYATISLDNYYVRLPYSDNSTWPVAFYSCDGTCYAIRQFNRDDPSSDDADPGGFAEFTNLSNLSGACSYLSKLYCNQAGVIYSLTNFDWSAQTVTETSLGGPGVGSTSGLFAFKDRLWTWSRTTIYYTDAPTSAGGYPETWNVSSNFIVITAERGQPKIFNIIPSGNLLYVFTSSGLFTINVSGAPLNWYPRLLDATVSVNHQACAYEHKGLIYFIDPTGVYVTNGSEVYKLSEKIQPVFEETQENRFYLYKLFPFDEGIIICKTKFFIEDGPSPANKFLSDADVYYTRLDNIAWTKFELNTTSQIMDIVGSWSRLETHTDWQGANYLALAFGQSTEVSPSDGTVELVKYAGYQDIVRRESQDVETASVQGSFKSKIIRGEMFQLKRSKYAYINLSANTSLPDAWNVSYSWDTETQANIESGTVTSNISALPESLVKIKADFQFRHTQVSLGFTLDSGISEYSFLGLGMVLHTHRREPRRDS